MSYDDTSCSHALALQYGWMHSLPHEPQLSGSVLPSSSQPGAAPQSRYGVVHDPTVHVPAVQTPLACGTASGGALHDAPAAGSSSALPLQSSSTRLHASAALGCVEVTASSQSPP